MKFLNLDLMAEPANWFIITLMVMTASLGLQYIFVSYNKGS